MKWLRNDWESDFFGREIYLLQSDSEIPSALPCGLLQAKIPSTAGELFAKLQQQGFEWIESEWVFHWDLSAESLVQHRQNSISTAHIGHIAELQQRFGGLFAQSRFHPPYFSLQENQRFYRCWIENAVKGQFDRLCLIAQAPSGEIDGMLSLRIVDKEAKIGLLAVTEASRRQGIASRLILEAKAWAMAQGADRLSVATQASNLSAIALYQHLGAGLYQKAHWLYREVSNIPCL